MLASIAASWVLSWVVATDVTGDPTSVWTLLGPFAAAALAMGFGWRESLKRLDKAEERLAAMNETYAPVIIEIRDVLRAVHDTMSAEALASTALAEAMKRIPSTEEIVRMRDLLARFDPPPRPDTSPSPWRT